MGSTSQDTATREGAVVANGIEFCFLEAGAGPLALCLHGFPDTAHSWRHLLPALADAGFRAVAPFMRGYAPSGCAPDGDYELGALVEDAVALHEALGGDGEAVLIGSDWGAEAAYGAAALAPERWRRLVVLAIPPRPLHGRLLADYRQLQRFFYLFYLRVPGAERTVGADDMAFPARLWEDWSPGYDAAEDLRWVRESLADPANLDAAIAYYRALEPEARAAARSGPHAAASRAALETPSQPTLYLHGERDGCIGVELVGDAEAHLAPGSRFEAIAGAGHFLHLERPEEVNRLIVEWVGPS